MKQGAIVKTTFAAAVTIAAAAWAIRRASSLSQRVAVPDRPPTHDPAISSLSRAVASQTSLHPERSGLHLLSDGLDAFATRLLLVRAAQATLDLQYYIWHGDRTGTLLLEALHATAERGVRVRLLVDDNGIAGLDRTLAALDRHPNIAVRIFNPFRIRFPKAIGYLADFARLNRRMHNKSFTADRAVTIIGGRNIGDEYFGAADGALFADLDVLAVGPAVDAVVADFERYWCSPLAYPAAQILPAVGARQLSRLARRSSMVEADPSAGKYIERLRSLPIVRELLEGTLPLRWATVELFSDDPAKILDGVADHDLLAPRLEEALGGVERELGLIAGYFVPGEEAANNLARLARQGRRVSILTNGYAANDVALVHAGYAPRRRELVAAGVALFEMRAPDTAAPTHRDRRRGAHLGAGSRLRGTGTGSAAALRSGASTLHAKTFTVDRERLFIGSFNLDPRSIRLNTEIGFLIHSAELARVVAEAFDRTIPDHAYRVTLDDGDRLTWTCSDQSLTREPGMKWTDHALIGLASRLPIAWLL